MACIENYIRVLQAISDVPDHIDKKPVISANVHFINFESVTQAILGNIDLNCEHVWLLNFVQIVTLHLLM
jgi:hypothetical protein